MGTSGRLVFAIVVLAGGWRPAACAQQPVGWRGDGNGRYPEATPVLEFALDKNVIWKTPLPGAGNCGPVLVGDKIIVTAEPDILLCISAADGKILWQKANPESDALAEAEKAEHAAKRKEAQALEARLKALGKQLGELKKAQKDAPQEKAGEEKIAALSGEAEQLKKEIEKLSRYLPARCSGVAGYSTATPVTDGQFVYALFGSGIAVCYDMSGERKWIRFVERSGQGHGHAASPLLAGGLLLAHFNDLTALDARTGEVRWRAAAKALFGTPVLARAGDADVVVTPNGELVRLSDGKVVATNFAKIAYGSPIVSGNIVYYVEGKRCKAVQPPASAGDGAQPKALWSTAAADGRYFVSPLLHNGLLWTLTEKGKMSVLDAQTGAVVYEKDLELGKSGLYYSCPTLGGKHVFICREDGSMVMLEPGREYKEVARAKLESLRSAPFFRGGRMYVRALKNLYCIGR